MSARGQIRAGSQEALILDYLATGAELTPLDALQRFNCLRLAARIYALRQDGVDIAERTVRQGKKAWSAYRIGIPY